LEGSDTEFVALKKGIVKVRLQGLRMLPNVHDYPQTRRRSSTKKENSQNSKSWSGSI